MWYIHIQRSTEYNSWSVDRRLVMQLGLTTFVTVALSNYAIKLCQVEKGHSTEKTHRKYLQTNVK